MWDLIVSVPDHCLSFCLTNFTDKVACKQKTNQANFALKSDTATQACITLKKKHLTSRLGQRHSHEQ